MAAFFVFIDDRNSNDTGPSEMAEIKQDRAKATREASILKLSQSPMDPPFCFLHICTFPGFFIQNHKFYYVNKIYLYFWPKFKILSWT